MEHRNKAKKPRILCISIAKEQNESDSPMFSTSPEGSSDISPTYPLLNELLSPTSVEYLSMPDRVTGTVYLYSCSLIILCEKCGGCCKCTCETPADTQVLNSSEELYLDAETAEFYLKSDFVNNEESARSKVKSQNSSSVGDLVSKSQETCLLSSLLEKSLLCSPFTSDLKTQQNSNRENHNEDSDKMLKLSLDSKLLSLKSQSKPHRTTANLPESSKEALHILSTNQNESETKVGLLGNVCDNCKKVFSTKAYLRRHLESHCHFSKALVKLKCIYCDDLYACQTTLKRHVLRQHNFVLTAKEMNAFPKVTFNSSKSYDDNEIHQRSPDKENLQCHHCNNRFSKSSTLKRHIQLYCPELPKKRFQCNWCKTPKSLPNVDAVQTHVFKVHNTIISDDEASKHPWVTLNDEECRGDTVKNIQSDELQLGKEILSPTDEQLPTENDTWEVSENVEHIETVENINSGIYMQDESVIITEEHPKLFLTGESVEELFKICMEDF